MRRTIARRMTESKQRAPHFYVETDVVMDGVVSAIERADVSRRVTLTAFLARACALALKAHPELNSVWSERGLERFRQVNLGVAVALDTGLIAPALLGADALTLDETVGALGDLVDRARRGKLRVPELTEGTFTLSNLGMFDVTRFTAIIVPPQVAILAAGRTVQRPVVVDDEIVVRKVVSVTVSADHRAVDGADVARFLATFKSLMEAPEEISG
jgi:pyruvate dehydrogenase E2 component (dihydrolipoamide acetyltransferase)